jgi:hypothetical protein
MSLHSKLNAWIKSEQGNMVDIDTIEYNVKSWGYKVSNYERRLRASESPNIERVFKNGAIVGYRWKQSEAVASFMREWGTKSKVEPIKTGQLTML